MFSSGPNYTKLKTHLRLAINRLKLLEKKKSELTQKARKEIADYISTGKTERARIRVEHIIREDYLVEAMEIVEMYCDLLLARFGLIQQMKTLDEGLSEPISSLLWVAPRLQTDIPEMKIIQELLVAKYGRQYAEACREEALPSISEKLRHKMSVQSPPKILVERYLMEIAKNYNIEYEPDPQVMRDHQQAIGADALLLDFNDTNRNDLGNEKFPPQPAGFVGFPQPPLLPGLPPSDFQKFKLSNKFCLLQYVSQIDPERFCYRNDGKPSGGVAGGFVSPPPLPPFAPVAPGGYNIPPGEFKGCDFAVSPDGENANKPLNTNMFQDESLPPPYSDFAADSNNKNEQNNQKPKPVVRSKVPYHDMNLPELPSVPSDGLPMPDEMDDKDTDDIDFDDLTRRFEELKKKK